jgi:hypothetical protein
MALKSFHNQGNNEFRLKASSSLVKGEIAIVYAQSFTGTLHAIMHHQDLPTRLDYGS